MTLKIMHTGDIHLGMKFNQYPSISNKLELSRYQVLEKLIKRANQKNANLFVIAGDLFDKINIKDKNIKKTAEILDKFAGDVIAVLPGNHDYYDGVNTLWKQFDKYIKGKIIVLSENKIYKLNNYGLPAAIYPAPCRTKLSAENNLNWIKNLEKKNQEKYNLVIAHGALAGFSPDLKDNYFKMTRKELLNLNMDLCLLGHSHLSYPQKKKISKQIIFNSGTPEPDGMDCRHPGYAWYIELNENKEVKAEKIKSGNYIFLDLQKEVFSKKDLEKLAAEILDSRAGKKILRLKIKGELPKDDFRKKDNILRDIRDNCFYSQINQEEFNIKLDQELIAEEFSETSFPYQILKELENNYEAMHLAYKMLKEVQE